MSTKPEQRALFRAARRAIPSTKRADAEQQALERLVHLFEPDAHVMLYIGIRAEFPTRGILDALLRRGQPLSIPRVEGDRIVAARLTEPGDLVPGRYGVPTSLGEAPEKLHIVLTPGVAFTTCGQRLGQGGGYYDRFFAQHNRLWRIGLAFDEQIATTLPTAAHDQRVHTVLTPTRMWGASAAP